MSIHFTVSAMKVREDGVRDDDLAFSDGPDLPCAGTRG